MWILSDKLYNFLCRLCIYKCDINFFWCVYGFFVFYVFWLWKYNGLYYLNFILVNKCIMYLEISCICNKNEKCFYRYEICGI